MRFGVVILPEHRRAEAERLWRRAEELGFDSAWTYDHLTWRSLRDGPWLAAVPTLAAAAMVTTRIRLGPLVASPNFRHPVTFAKELMTLDDLAQGRLTLGIGAGGTGYDATALGQEPWPARERGERFVEFIDLLDRLLREPATTWRGRWYAAIEARSIPGCVQRPRIPFAVAAVGPRALRLAARHGAAWVTTDAPPGVAAPTLEERIAWVARQSAALDRACAAEGRDPASLARMVLAGAGAGRALASVEELREIASRYAAIGIDEIAIHHPRSGEPYAGDVATFERIVLDGITSLR